MPRVRRLPISVSMLPALLRDGAGWLVVRNPLPADARFVSWSLEGPHRDLVLIVESDSYAEVAEGQPIPDVDLVLFEDRPPTEPRDS